MEQPGRHGPERRTNLRLRTIIDDLQTGVREIRSAVETLNERVAAISKDLEALKTRRG